MLHVGENQKWNNSFSASLSKLLVITPMTRWYSLITSHYSLEPYLITGCNLSAGARAWHRHSGPDTLTHVLIIRGILLNKHYTQQWIPAISLKPCVFIWHCDINSTKYGNIHDWLQSLRLFNLSVLSVIPGLRYRCLNSKLLWRRWRKLRIDIPQPCLKYAHQSRPPLNMFCLFCLQALASRGGQTAACET